MQDFTKEFNTKTLSRTNQTVTIQTSWLTKNRFWNLVFLFVVPAQIYLAALMWNGWMLLLPLATTIAIFGFVPVDKSAVDNREPQIQRV